MTVQTTNAYSTATGTGSATSFPFSFACRDASDLDVYVGGILQGAGYTVALNVGFNGGTVTFATAPANGAVIVFASNPSFLQQTSFLNAGDYNPSMVDGVADAAAIRDIYMDDQLNRAIRGPIGEPPIGLLPPISSRQNKILSFDNSGNPVPTDPSSLTGGKGDPGGNVMAIGLFTAASGLTIPVGTDLVQTSGYSTGGKGHAVYVYDATVNSAYVSANPNTSFLSANGRGFRLSTRQVLNIYMYGAAGDGDVVALTGTDDTAVFGIAFAHTKLLYVPDGVFCLTGIVPPAGMTVITQDAATVFLQKGASDGTRLITIQNSDITFGSCTVAGSIAINSGEQNHGFFITTNGADVRNTKIGNVHGLNLRGDAVYVGAVATDSTWIYGTQIGSIYADNCWRNALSVTDGVDGCVVAGVFESAVAGCGHCVLDAEPNQAKGVNGLVVGRVRGRFAVASSTTAIIEATIHSMALDPTFGAPSNPSNPGASPNPAFTFRSAILNIGSLYIHGHQVPPFGQANGGFLPNSIVNIGHAEFENNNLGVSGAAGAIASPGYINIGHFKTQAVNANQYGVVSSHNIRIRVFEYAGYADSVALSDAEGCEVDYIIGTVSSTPGAGNGGILMSATNGRGARVNGGTWTGDRLTNFCTGCTIKNVTATCASPFQNGTTANNRFVNCVLNGAFLDRWYRDTETLTQATSKSTPVAATKLQSDITLNNASIAANSSVSFTLNNALIDASDQITVQHLSGGTIGAYACGGRATGSGVGQITIDNLTAGALGEAIVVRVRISA